MSYGQLRRRTYIMIILRVIRRAESRNNTRILRLGFAKLDRLLREDSYEVSIERTYLDIENWTGEKAAEAA